MSSPPTKLPSPTDTPVGFVTQDLDRRVFVCNTGSEWRTIPPEQITPSLQKEAGTAASPSYSYLHRPDTGTYLKDGRNLGISVAGQQVAEFTDQDLRPAADDSHDLGDPEKRWSNVCTTNGVLRLTSPEEMMDRRPSELGLDFLIKLEPIQYRLAPTQNVVEDGIDGLGHPTTSTRRVDHSRLHVGFRPEDLERSLKEAGVADFGGFVRTRQGKAGYRPDQLLAVAIRSIQQLNERLRRVEGRLAAGIKIVSDQRPESGTISVPSDADQGEVADLRAQIKQLEETIRSGSLADISATSGFAQMRQQLAELKAELDDAKLDELRSELTQLQAQLSLSPSGELKEAVNALRSKVEAQPRQMAALRSKVEQMKAQLEAHPQSMEVLENQISEVKAQIASHPEQVNQIREQIAQIRQEVDRSPQTLQGISTSLEDLRSQVDSHPRQLEQLSTQVAQLKERVASTPQEIERLRTQVEKILAEMGHLRQLQVTVAQLSSKAGRVDPTQVERLESELESVRSSLTQLDRLPEYQSQLDSLRSQLGSVPSQMQELKRQMASIQQASATTPNQIQELRHQLQTLRSQVQSQPAALQQVSRQVDSLRATSEAQQAELRAELERVKSQLDSHPQIMSQLRSELDSISEQVASEPERAEQIRKEIDSLQAQVQVQLTQMGETSSRLQTLVQEVRNLKSRAERERAELSQTRSELEALTANSATRAQISSLKEESQRRSKALSQTVSQLESRVAELEAAPGSEEYLRDLGLLTEQLDVQRERNQELHSDNKKMIDMLSTFQEESDTMVAESNAIIERQQRYIQSLETDLERVLKTGEHTQRARELQKKIRQKRAEMREAQNQQKWDKLSSGKSVTTPE